MYFLTTVQGQLTVYADIKQDTENAAAFWETQGIARAPLFDHIRPDIQPVEADSLPELEPRQLIADCVTHAAYLVRKGRKSNLFVEEKEKLRAEYHGRKMIVVSRVGASPITRQYRDGFGSWIDVQGKEGRPPGVNGVFEGVIFDRRAFCVRHPWSSWRSLITLPLAGDGEPLVSVTFAQGPVSPSYQQIVTSELGE
jgi:hypothetical protein